MSSVRRPKSSSKRLEKTVCPPAICIVLGLYFEPERLVSSRLSTIYPPHSQHWEDLSEVANHSGNKQTTYQGTLINPLIASTTGNPEFFLEGNLQYSLGNAR